MVVDGQRSVPGAGMTTDVVRVMPTRTAGLVDCLGSESGLAKAAAENLVVVVLRWQQDKSRTMGLYGASESDGIPFASLALIVLHK